MTATLTGPLGLHGLLGGGGEDVPLGWTLGPVFKSSLTVNLQDGTMTSISFSPDGTKMFLIGDANESVYRYNLSTAWDITTAVFANSFSVGTQDGFPSGLFISPDGTKMFVMGGVNETVYRYNLSTAWDITTAVFANSFFVGTQDADPADVSFSPDGTKMFVVGYSGERVYRYNLSTAWDITTAVFANSFHVQPQDGFPRDVCFSSDGTKMFVMGDSNNAVFRYNLSTAWDITTAVFFNSFFVGDEDISPWGLTFSSDGMMMFVVGISNDKVYRYDI